MVIETTPIDGLLIATPKLWEDERGYFTEIFNKEVIGENWIDFPIAQVNQSLTKEKGMLRGMHFQNEPYAQDKIISCLKGSIYDVAIDVRRDSPTYLQWFGVMLSAENKQMLFVPKGFAHGFQSLEDTCLIQYFVSAPYNPEAEGGVRFDDPALGIKWPLPPIVPSKRDAEWPYLASNT
jgi:dTDP-4-dehydrorhamnose 3,5-epimerase